MSRMVEKQLHKNFDPIAPDFLSEIESAQIERIDSEDLLFSETDRLQGVKTAYRSLIGYASAAAVVVLCVISMFVYRNSYTTVETVTIQAGSTITMSLNRANKVIHVEMSEEEDLNRSDIEGRSFEESLERVLDSVSSSSRQGSKKVSISCEGSGNNSEARKIIDKVAKNYDDDYDIDITGSSQNVENVQSLDYEDSSSVPETQSSASHEIESEPESESDPAVTHPEQADEISVSEDTEYAEDTEADKADLSEAEEITTDKSQETDDNSTVSQDSISSEESQDTDKNDSENTSDITEQESQEYVKSEENTFTTAVDILSSDTDSSADNASSNQE